MAKESNNDNDGSQKLRIIGSHLGSASDSTSEYTSDLTLQFVRNSKGRSRVYSPVRKGELTVATQFKKRDGRRFRKQKQDTTLVNVPERDSDLTLPSHSLQNLKGRHISRSWQLDDNGKKNGISLMLPKPDQQKSIKDNSKEKEEFVLHCPNNYDDDISSISDMFLHSVDRAKEAGHERGSDFSFSFEGMTRRSTTTGSLRIERGRELYTPPRRSMTIGTTSEILEVLGGGRFNDDSIIGPREENSHKQDGDGDDSDDMVTLLSPLDIIQMQDEKKSSSGSVVVSLSSARGQDSPLSMPKTAYALGA